jgi:chemotaxis protein MotB
VSAGDDPRSDGTEQEGSLMALAVASAGQEEAPRRSGEPNNAIYSEVLEDEGPPEERLEKAPIWLVSFGDVTALMLAFFVMLYAMSHLQSEKWEAVISVLATRERPVAEGEPRPIGERTTTRISLVDAFPTGYLQRILEEKLGEDPLLSGIRITGLEDQLVLSLPAAQYFEGGGAVLSETGRRALGRIATVFGQFGNRIDIRGHAAPEPPPPGTPFEDAAELSLARALAVAKTLAASGYRGNPTVMGLGDSEFRHIDPTVPEDRRYELARRVDLVIVPEARGQ